MATGTIQRTPQGNKVEAGKRFGYLTVLSYSHSRKLGPHKSGYCTTVHYWLCRCDCGTEKLVRAVHLLNSHCRSCGCKASELSVISKGGHGQAKRKNYSRTYRAWAQMKTRVLNPKFKHYYRYGGRGISICASWLHSFEAFYADMGDCIEGMTLERVDNDGNYEPSNCKWIPRSEQASNTSRTIRVTVNGETHNVSQWANLLGANRDGLRWRIERYGPEAGVRYYMDGNSG